MTKVFSFAQRLKSKVQEQTSAQTTVYPILLLISIGHLFNDFIQAIVPAIYPLLKDNYGLDFAQIGMITFCFQISSSLLQPIVGNYTDANPKPYSQIYGMICSIIGIIILAYAPSYAWILVAVVLIGIGSSIFHPESSRVSFVASGGKRSLAQSIFQIGGNTGTALAPLLVAWIVLPRSQVYLLWFLVIGVVAQIVYYYIGTWYKGILAHKTAKKHKEIYMPVLSKLKINTSIVILLVLIFSKYFYVASISSYFQFYVMDKFSITYTHAQIYLFLFLLATALGTLIGGFFGDKFGRKYIIWFSVLGVAPLTLLLPYVGLFWTGVLIVLIGLIISSAFPSILVYAQELLPKKIGMVSGLFYGFAFGMGGVGSAVLGWLADKTSIEYIYHLCAFLPLLGIVAWFLPDMKKVKFILEK
ncbi:MFS transporter [Myroides sp. LJL116]